MVLGEREKGRLIVAFSLPPSVVSLVEAHLVTGFLSPPPVFCYFLFKVPCTHSAMQMDIWLHDTGKEKLRT